MRRFTACFLLTCLISLLCGCMAEPETTELLVLMYHHLDDVGDDSVTITPKTFDQHLKMIADAGYATVSPAELTAYADGEGTLPEKPVLIVFDDGYLSNYELAYPILSKHNAKASICVIGWSVGKDTYKDTGYPILPYFSWEQAKEMEASGLVSIGSHTYDLHQTDWIEPDPNNVRDSAARRENESRRKYKKMFTADHERISAEMEAALGHTPLFFAYPHGRWEPESERILKKSGVRITFITDAFRNTITKGDASSLYLLGRYNMNEKTDILAILQEETP